MQGFSNGALGPPWGHGAVHWGHEQRPSLGSFAVILHNPSVTIYYTRVESLLQGSTAHKSLRTTAPTHLFSKYRLQAQIFKISVS